MSFAQDWSSRRCYSWVIERPYEGRPRRTPEFSFKIRIEYTVYLEMSVRGKNYTIRLRVASPPHYSSSYTLRHMNITVHLEDRKRNALPLSSSKLDLNDQPIIWQCKEADILKVLPNFLEDGLLIFLVILNSTDQELVTETELKPAKEDIPVPVPVQIKTEDKCIQKFSDCSCLESLSADLSKLLEESLGSNVLLMCGDKSIGAHKNVLYARSKVLASMLEYDVTRDEFADQISSLQLEVDSEVFYQFVCYLHTGSLPDLTADTAKHLYEAGGRYAIGSLMRRCASFLLENLQPGNACEMLVLANDHNDSEFRESVVDYILLGEIPLLENQWLAFTESHAHLASKVLYRFFKVQKTK